MAHDARNLCFKGVEISIVVLPLDLDHKFSCCNKDLSELQVLIYFATERLYEKKSCDSFIYLVMFVTICITVAQLIAPNSLRYLVSKLC